MYKSVVIGIILIVCITSFVPIISYFYVASIDKEVWNEVIKHSDEFVFDQDKSNDKIVIMNLYDKDSTYICDAFIYIKSKKVTIFSHYDIVASSANIYKSRKMFKLLYNNIPEDVLSDCSPQKGVLNKLKTL